MRDSQEIESIRKTARLSAPITGGLESLAEVIYKRALRDRRD
jgi:hypothetical protein